MILNETCFFSYDEPGMEDRYYNGEPYTLVFTEEEVLTFIRTKFVFTDEQFEKMKKLDGYSLYIDHFGVNEYEEPVPSSWYKDGKFYLEANGWMGDSPSNLHQFADIVDDGKGVLKIYYDYSGIAGDENDNAIPGEVMYQYVVEYVYSGTGGFEVTPHPEGWENHWIISSYDKESIDSLRVRSIKKVKK